MFRRRLAALGGSLYPLPNFGSVLRYDTYWYNSANTAAGTPGDAGAFPVQMRNMACNALPDSTGSLLSGLITFGAPRRRPERLNGYLRAPV